MAPAREARDQLPASRARATRAVGGVMSIVLAASLVLAVLAGAGAAAGYRGVVVLSGSMEPRLSTGDLALVRRTAITAIRPGEVITFTSPAGFSVTHRVRSLRGRTDGRVAVVTRGDANPAPERWSAPRAASVGRVVGVVPGAGRLLGWTTSRDGRLGVLGAIAAAGLALALRRIWRS